MFPLVLCGLAATAAYVWLALGGLPLGSPIFFVPVAIATAAYLVSLSVVHRARCTWPLLIAAGLLAVVMRAPLALTPVGGGSDMFRYVWDARVQRAGLSPYETIPQDPRLAHIHNDETRKMNNTDITSPYPPGAQVFFRLSTVFSDRAMAIKIALVLLDLATAVIVALWLRALNRSPLLAIIYAWNPLVILEISHSGHLDGAGMFAVALAGYALSTGRRALSVSALAAGIAIKFLPLVLIPLWWKRVRWPHAALGAGIIGALYLMFMDVSGDRAPVGSVTNMIRTFRFNGPVFKAIDWVATPRVAAAFAVAAGLACAFFMRRSRHAEDPAAFAWPMAAALVCSPVVYPWYLVWLAPFLLSLRLTWPLVFWSLFIPSIYIVWWNLQFRGAWAVPLWMGIAEYGILLVGTVMVALSARAFPSTPPPESRVP